MKKLLSFALSVSMVASLFVGCGATGDANNAAYSTASASLDSDISTEVNEEYETRTDVTAEGEQEIIVDLKPIDVFESVELVCEGWNGLGTVVEISTSDCSDFIQDNVIFSLETSYSDLQNGDTVVVIAQYDKDLFVKNGYEVIEDTHEFEVESLKKIIEGQDYHDGVAWVRTGGTEWCCCDTEGNILFMLDKSEVPVTHFANGVAIIGTLLGENTAVIDKTGNVVWSTEDGHAYGEERWGSGSIKSVSIFGLSDGEEYYGYTRIRISVDSFNITGWFTGVIDNEGNWWIEPTGIELSYFEYCLYKYFNTDNKYYLNNILTNEIINTESKDTYELWILDYITENHDGLAFRNNSYSAKTGYYDSNYKLKIDLSGYNVYEAYEFNDGYALIDITNAQGSGYYIIIDTSGNEMFSPKKGVDHGELKCGYYWVKGVGYMNVYGEEAFDIALKDGEDFSEGMAYVTTADSNHHYINTDGEIVF